MARLVLVLYGMPSKGRFARHERAFACAWGLLVEMSVVWWPMKSRSLNQEGHGQRNVASQEGR